MYIIKRNELYHFGILGMHWGERHGPPYPLSYEQHSSSQKSQNAGKHELGNYHYNYLQGKNKNNKKQQKLKDQSDRSISNKIFDDDKTNHQKSVYRKKLQNAMVGAAVVVGVSGAVYLAYRSGVISRISSQIKEGKIAPDIFKKACMDSADDVQHVLKQGEVLKRVHFDTGGFEMKSNKNLFVAFEHDDIETYKGLLEKHGGLLGGTKRYQAELKIVNDLIYPSEKEAARIFDEAWKNNEELRREVIDTLAKENNAFGLPLGKTNAERLIKQKGSHYWGNWVLAKHGTKANDLVRNEYVNRGYNAVLDFHDQKDGLAKKPLIVFNPTENLKLTSNKLITEAERKSALEYTKKHGRIMGKMNARLYLKMLGW